MGIIYGSCGHSHIIKLFWYYHELVNLNHGGTIFDNPCQPVCFPQDRHPLVEHYYCYFATQELVVLTWYSLSVWINDFVRTFPLVQVAVV